MSNFDEQRARMVRDHLAARGVRSAHVLSAMRVVPRESVQNARLVADAERHYRIMYYGSVASWNLRDEHMFEVWRELIRGRFRYGQRQRRGGLAQRDQSRWQRRQL
jgi:erythromycin esterase-like protein